MPSFDLHRIAEETFVERIDFHDRLDSTNDLALSLLSVGPTNHPLLVLADQQQAGRGRANHHWWAAAGSLTFSLVLDGQVWGLSARCWPRLSLVTSLAVGEVLLQTLPDGGVRLKWPNDVFLGSRKVCGILVESAPQCPNFPVIGVGLNVNNSLANAPHSLRETGTSLVQVAGHTLDRTDLLIRVLRQLADRLAKFGDSGFSLPDHWGRLCMLQGRTVCIAVGAHRTIGICQGIDDDGALLVQSEARLERCFSGVVECVY